MNIAILNDGLGHGGAERVTSILSNYWAKEGNHVILFLEHLEKDDYKINNGIKVYIVPHKSNRLIQILSRLLFLRNVFLKEKIKYTISMSNTFGMYACVLKRSCKLFTICSERNNPSTTPKKRIYRFFRNLMFQLSDCIVFQTEGAMNYFSTRIKKKGVVIPNPISTNLPVRYVGERDKTIVMFSRLEPQKNIYMALNAFKAFCKENSSYSMHIYGRGSLMRELCDYVSKDSVLSGKVFFRGFQQNVFNLVSRAGMFISSSDYEGLSNSMLEALAMGIPTICTDCPPGGARSVIKDGENGLLVGVGEVSQLAEAINRIANNKELALRLSNNGYLIREDFNEKNICKKWSELLDDKSQ